MQENAWWSWWINRHNSVRSRFFLGASSFFFFPSFFFVRHIHTKNNNKKKKQTKRNSCFSGGLYRVSRYLLLFYSLNELSTFFLVYILATFVFPNRRIQTVARIGEHEKGIWTRKRVFWDKGREPRTTCPRVRSLIAIFWFQPSQETCFFFVLDFKLLFGLIFFFYFLFLFLLFDSLLHTSSFDFFFPSGFFFFCVLALIFLSLSLSCFRLHNTKVATPTRRKKKESEKKKKEENWNKGERLCWLKALYLFIDGIVVKPVHDFWSLHLKGSPVCARSQTKDERSRHSPLALSFTDLNVEAKNKQTIKSNQTEKKKTKQNKQTNKKKTIIIITAKKKGKREKERNT